MSSASRHHDDGDEAAPPRRPWLPRPPGLSTSTSSTSAAAPLTDLLDTMPMGGVDTSAPHHLDGGLCDTQETQELLDNFFALYASPDQGSASAPCAARPQHRQRLPPLDAEGEVAEEQSPRRGDEAKNTPSEHDGEDEDEEGPVGRTDGHHAQQSQYVPVEEEDEEEDSNDVDKEDTVMPPSRPSLANGLSAAAELDGAANSRSPPPPTSSTTLSASSLEQQCKPAESVFWPFAHPPPSTALPLDTQTRAAFHTRRYGAFIKAYLGLSDEEVRQAERRGRGICMIGVRRVARHGKASAASPISYSFASPRLMPTCNGAAGDFPAHPFRCVRPSNADPVRTQRVFLRHSVLAVEGDAVFCQLIDRAETLYAVEQQRMEDAAAAVAGAALHRKDDDKDDSGDFSTEGGTNTKAKSEGQPAKDLHGRPTTAPGMYPQFRRLPRVTEPYLRPNARCIALHYGLPDHHNSLPSSSASNTNAAASPRRGAEGAGQTEASATTSTTTATTTDSSEETCFPRATLIAVVSTTRLEENGEIYISMDSYYRCLDEIEWYRRCYRHLNERYGCRASLELSRCNTPTSCCPTTAPSTELHVANSSHSAHTSTAGTGDVYTGVKHFPAWPAELAFYHGVGKRHASRVAEGAFPFTLVELGAAPELGDGQKGVVASSWIPYGTCLLYCGPAVATRKVEKVVTSRVFHGSAASPNPARAAGDGGGVKAVVGAAAAEGLDEDAEEDLSFVTDDTYALGLGRHGVCFGQGLTRYINHRYNTSRFGNVELCSVMLSVPSEFSTEGGGGSGAQKSPPSDGAAILPSDPTLTEEENTRLRFTVRKQHGRNSGGGNARSADVSATAAAAAAPPRGKRKQAPLRRAQRFFLEEKSFFVTVPFFLVTTDIPPGASLLAWTYGEDYDAKLERQAVAEGHIVPYADAAVLNRRLTTPSPGRSLQRYGGDYRFAVGAGDVVWRRRPLLPSSSSSVLSSAFCAGGAAWLVPPPEDDLFVIVQTQRGSVEQVLLQPLVRVELTDAALDGLLREQHLLDYVSPHVSSSAADGRRQPHREAGRGGPRGRAAAGGRKGYRRVAPAWSQHWAVFELPDSAIAGTSATLSLARAEDALRRCCVATVESVGLLQPDIDYSVVHSKRPESGGSGGRGRPGQKGGGRRARLVLDTPRQIVVNLDDLHHATHLVRASAERATAVPVLLNGLLWPLFSAHVERSSGSGGGGGPVGSNGGGGTIPVR
ncbi:hypothetical protein ABB37_08471 [Leptomonas pyrrhocoris]|uniref:SET domain-containing protein n=1 Tax=Leptomonas pyrrhocoris TaxID=157538 RepID=A0A0M9FT87_LEPPY|nr:hypothetical protein ABB37_08471 [Leptomonas pyrrhocoris]KPA75595.1 hypothetical protein ABB37_08471 [Leptomonas pyrrhocoris]|eukprot:XP_015654034.1 hypothetical protein ABB37_08471 [Leptomonas pyrrhocoris]